MFTIKESTTFLHTIIKDTTQGGGNPPKHYYIEPIGVRKMYYYYIL